MLPGRPVAAGACERPTGYFAQPHEPSPHPSLILQPPKPFAAFPAFPKQEGNNKKRQSFWLGPSQLTEGNQALFTAKTLESSTTSKAGSRQSRAVCRRSLPGLRGPRLRFEFSVVFGKGNR